VCVIESVIHAPTVTVLSEECELDSKHVIPYVYVADRRYQETKHIFLTIPPRNTL